jgi:hypothetical protein
VAAFLLLPITRLWRISPWLSLLLAGALAATVPLLAPEQVEAPGAGHEHVAAAPLRIDVHLAARPAGAGRVTLSWTLDLHHDDPSVPLPHALWLLVSAGAHSEDFALVEDTSTLVGPATLREGEHGFEVPEGAREITGQLWSGPYDASDAMPVDGATVLGCAVP